MFINTATQAQLSIHGLLSLSQSPCHNDRHPSSTIPLISPMIIIDKGQRALRVENYGPSTSRIALIASMAEDIVSTIFRLDAHAVIALIAGILT
jgi:hypothetical protein